MADEIIDDAGAAEVDNNEGDNGGANEVLEYPKWMSSLPDDLKTNKVLAQFKSIGDAGKTLAELRSDEKVLRIPGEDASDEEKTAFYQKLGRPETADKYTITKPEGLPDDVPYEPSIEPWFKDVSYKLNLSAKQAEGLYNEYWNFVKGGSEANKKAVEASVNALKDEWKGDKFKTNTAIATRAWKELGKGHDAFLEKIVDGIKLGDHPEFLKWYHEIGLKMLPDSGHIGNEDRGSGEGDQTEETIADKMFPSMNKK